MIVTSQQNKHIYWRRCIYRAKNGFRFNLKLPRGKAVSRAALCVSGVPDISYIDSGAIFFHRAIYIYRADCVNRHDFLNQHDLIRINAWFAECSCHSRGV